MACGTTDRLLSWFGAERYERDLRLVRRFWAGEGRHIVSVQPSRFAYRQNFDDEAVAMPAKVAASMQSRPRCRHPRKMLDSCAP